MTHSRNFYRRDRLKEAVEIAGLLDRNTEELGSLLRALNGEYVLPEAGGDLLRDGAGVLPTGAWHGAWHGACIHSRTAASVSR